MNRFPSCIFSRFTNTLASTAFIIAMSVSGGTSAALLGVEPSLPLINFNNTGVTDYDAGTTEFSISNAVPLAILFPPFRNVFDSTSDGRKVDIQILVDNSGNLIGGVPGDDLVVTGAVDTTGDSNLDADGVLLTGEVVAFGSNDSGGPTDFYDFRFVVTGGALAAFYTGQDIGIVLTSESSNFTGNFTVDFGGGAKGNIGPIPPRASLGDRVWEDLDTDGDQDCANAGGLTSSDKIPGDGGSTCAEPPVPDVPVALTDCQGNVLDTTSTDNQGFYLFTGLNPGTYCVEFTKPEQCEWTVQDQGATDLTDSDVNPNTGEAGSIDLAAGETDRSWDAGLVCEGPDIDIEKATNGVDADDPNAGDAPQVIPGGLVNWTYKITNTGPEPLQDIVVTDDQGVVLACPGQPTILNPGAMFTCTASGLADDLNDSGFTTVPGTCGSVPNTPMYENMGHVSATGVNSGDFVQDVDPSHYCNPQQPAIDIEKFTNGQGADDPNGGNADGDAPAIAIGGLVSWTYVITNIGNEPLHNVTVVDDQGVVLSCPGQPAVLDPGDSFQCTASGLADDLNTTGFTTVPGTCGSIPNTPMYENKGIATGNGINSGQFVQDEDPSHYCNPQEPDIDIEKATNGVDADNPNSGDAPQVVPGGPVSWTYVVTNIGNEPLVNVSVVDDQGIPVACPKTVLAPAESMNCTASGLADDLNSTTFTTVPGLCGGFPATPMYENKGKATGNGSNSGQFVEDEDPSHYCNPPEPGIDIEKLTNGVQADDPNAGDAPQVVPGGPVSWTYVVTNTGNTTLNNVVVIDDQIGPITCPKTTLVPGESMNCSSIGVADDLNDTTFTTVPGLCGSFPQTPLYENMGKATGQSTTGEFVEDDDPSHYCNPPGPAIQLEKLTNGFDADTRDETSTSTGGSPTVPSINAGATVTWTYQVTNTGNTVLNPVTVSDDAGTPGMLADDFCTPNAGACGVVINCPFTALNAGQTMNCTAQQPAHDLTVFAPVVAGQCGGVPSDLYENGAIAVGTPPSGSDVSDDDPSHYCNPGVCNLEVNKTCLVIPPPTPDVGVGSCQKPIDVLKLEYAGGPAITSVTWYAGNVSAGNLIRSTTATEVTILNAGGVVEFNGFEVNNSPNDVQMVTSFDNGTSVTSEYHLSCSDPDMNGPEDCGTVIGDGKNNDLPASSNIWTFRGTARLDGAGISCPLPPVDPGFPTQTACEFTPPPSAASCSDIKDITALTMIWQGANGVSIETEGGETITGINSGDIVTFSTAGLGNDVDLTLSGAVNGISRFHVSCSDQEMNGPEDCGASEGNGKGNDSGLINDWALEGMTGEQGVIDCAVVQGRSGAQVSYGIEVNNLNNEVVNVTIVDTVLGLNQVENIPANSTFQLVTDPALIVPDGTNTFVNVVNVSGQTSSGASCDGSATAMVTRIPPPPAPVSCGDIKPISALSMVWDGVSGVNIVTEGGQQFNDVQNGNQITFSTVGLGNDVDLTFSGAATGSSRFHVSCSDQAMNGSEDCGSNQGNGKNNDSGFNNEFLFDGMTGESGAFDCGLNNTGIVDPSTGGGSGGAVTGAAALNLGDDKKAKWELTNNGNQDVLITRVFVMWPAAHGQLKTFKLAGVFAKDVFDNASPTDVPTDKAFESDASKRRLTQGATKNLEIEFTEKYKNHTQGEFTITVEFDNGETLSFP